MNSSLLDSRVLAAVVALTASALSAAPVLPGYLTDPSVMKGTLAQDTGYQPPERLKYPYVSTYYVKPTVKVGEAVKVAFFVTDFESSRIRFLDDSHRFTAHLEYRLRGGVSKTLTLKDLTSGDQAFDLGQLPAGAYEMRLWVVDAQGRESHRVIHDFRVVAAEDLAIPADKVYRMTAADLAAYGIRNDGDLEKIVYVHTNGTSEVVKEKRTDAPGYVVTVPLDPKTDKMPVQAYKVAKVAYDTGYDKAAVEQAAVANVTGLQRLLDDKAAAGFRKFVLHPGTYRLSYTQALLVPDRMTLDLNGAVIKQNAFTGAHSILVNLTSVTDAHLVNGTLEGDYWTHDYVRSPKNSEWPAGFQLGGASWYSSVENVKVVDITGYGGQNGIAKDAKGWLSYFFENLPKYAPGGLDRQTGAVDASDTFRFTTDFKDLGKVLEKGVGRVQVSKHLGYQGRETRSWQMTVAWYDAEKRFISAETSWQYREMWIPAKAAFMRVSIEEESVEKANKCQLSLTAMRQPINCAVRKCTFDHCRCVGYAASAMKNMLFEGNFFTRSGENAACCAFDAEDGWDQMQDVYFLGNIFHDNPRNNSILTCAGHNFILEGNMCDIHFWGRTHSPCVRGNWLGRATYCCDSRLRSGYGRFDGNTYTKGVALGENDGKSRPDSWDYVLSDLDFDGGKDAFLIEVGLAGRLVNCRFRNMSVRIANAYACTFENCNNEGSWKAIPGGRWFEVTVKDSKFKRFFNTNVCERCHFSNTKFEAFNFNGSFTANDCDFTACSFFGFSPGSLAMTGCQLADTTVAANYWERPSTFAFTNCTIRMREDASFLKLGGYTIGSISFDGCTATGKPSLVNVSDLRPIKLLPNADPATSPDRLPGAIVLRNTRLTGEAKTVIAVAKERTPSTKPITICDKGGNAWPEGTPLTGDLPPSWQVK